MFGAPSAPAGVAGVGGVDRAKRGKGMVGGSLLEPPTRPPDEPGALLLEEGRKGAVALLATNLPECAKALSCYRRRMWIEEMFADFKGHGFDLESTQLRSFGGLSGLTLAVSKLYVWLVEHGARVIKRGQRRMVDRSDRRDHSVFRLGCDMLDRCLAQVTRPSIRLLPRSLPKLSGG
jgi:hypothetical protein